MKYFMSVVICVMWSVGGMCLSGVKNVEKDTTIKPEDMLVTDVVTAQKISSNIICLASNADTITWLNWGNNALTILDYTGVNNDIISKIYNVYIRDNKLPLYIIIIPKADEEQSFMNISSAIRSVDQEGRIVVIYKEKVSMMQLPKGVYNIYLFVPVDNEVSGYDLYEVCKYCHLGADLIEISNSWKPASHFRNPLVLRGSFRGSYHGAEMRIGCAYPFYPNVYTIGKDGEGNDILDGANYRMYEVLGKMLSVRFSYNKPKDGVDWQLISEDNTPVGSMKDLHRKDVDIVGCGWRGTYARYKLSDFSTYILRLPQDKMISLKPEKGIQWYAIIQPFHWMVWLCIAVSVPAVGSILYVLRRFGTSPDQAASYWDDMWDSTVIILWDSITSYNPSCSVSMLLSSYMVCVFLIVNYYVGDLVGCLVAVKNLAPPIDKFEQVWESDLQMLARDSLAPRYRSYFKHVANIDENIVKVSSEGDDPTANLLKIFFDNPKKYVLLDEESLWYDMAKQYPDLYHSTHTSKEGVGMIFTYLIHLPQFPEKEAINRKLTLMHDMGMIYTINERFDPSGEYLSTEIEVETLRPQIKSIVTINELKLGFLLLVILYFIAFVSFLAEIQVRKFKNKRHVLVKSVIVKQTQEQSSISVTEVRKRNIKENTLAVMKQVD